MLSSLLVLHLLAGLNVAGANAVPIEVCRDGPYAGLDFLSGRWSSVWLARNVQVGTYTFAKAADGCALTISWVGAPDFPGSGSGLQAYDPADKAWRYMYVGEDGTVTSMAGRREGSAWVFEGDRNDPKALQTRFKVRWTITAQADGTLLEQWQASRDDGATWRPYGQFKLTPIPAAGS